MRGVVVPPRVEPPGNAGGAPAVAAPLLIRHRAAERAAATPANRPQPATAASANSGRPATIVTPSAIREPPPQLAESYPASTPASSSRWGVSLDMLLPSGSPGGPEPRVHKVVDGDTLASLAERYLGHSHRGKEIFEANRDILSNPGLLPIGVELKIPPRERPSPPPPTLVPVNNG